jgi:hypothetical protein
MNSDDSSDSGSLRLWILTLLLTTFLAACSSSSSPTASGVDYEQAKMMFKQGNLDRALSLTDAMAAGNSNSPGTLRALVLRAAIYSGRIDAYRELADTYKKGAEAATKSQSVAAYSRRRSNAMQYGSEAALNLGEAVMQLTSKKDFPKELTLDAPWPNGEGPQAIDDFARIRRGAGVPEDAQDNAAIDVQHRAIAGVLGELVGGDHSKARAAIEAGPVKLNGLDFALFLQKQLLEGIELFGPNYLANPGQSKTLCGVAERLNPPIETMLKEHADSAKEAEFKKLQEQIKDAENFT